MTKAERKLISKITDLREAGHHQQALALAGRLILRFLKKTDYRALFDVLSSRCLIWKHLFQLSSLQIYRLLMREDARLGLELAQAEGLKSRLHVAHFRLGEALMVFRYYKGAVQQYQLALRHYHGSRLGEALYRGGKVRLGEKTLLVGLREIQADRHSVDSFLADVWESGAYMRLAELLRKDKPDQAKLYLDIAEGITKSDKLLIMRKKQLKLLLAKLESKL